MPAVLIKAFTGKPWRSPGTYARIDLRMNASDCYVQEINAMPGVGPERFLPHAARSIPGLDCERRIQRLAEVSMMRQGEKRNSRDRV